MTLSYFKKQIMEELDGAKEYIEKAIEVKPNHPRWSMYFAKMADMEAGHAGNLMHMLEDSIRTHEFKQEMEPADAANTGAISRSMDPREVYKDLMKHFGETMTYVKNMKRGL